MAQAAAAAPDSSSSPASLSASAPSSSAPGPPPTVNFEPLRQNMLTMHTLLNEKRSSGPTWFVGQWVDVRDTVHQWLEATIIDIATAEEVGVDECGGADAAAAAAAAAAASSRLGRGRTPMDPPVAAHDLASRSRLLKSEDDPAQLLLIHYNGWPARWDDDSSSSSSRSSSRSSSESRSGPRPRTGAEESKKVFPPESRHR